MERQTSSVAFFDKIYDETFSLLVRTRDYLSDREPAATLHVTPNERLRLTTLTMRLTAQLTDIMAWLLIQKAANAGEVSHEKAHDEKYRLLRWTHAQIEFEHDPTIPMDLKNLLTDTQRIYARVTRLQSMISERIEEYRD